LYRAESNYPNEKGNCFLHSHIYFLHTIRNWYYQKYPCQNIQRVV